MSTWKTKYYLTAYELAAAGLPDSKIASELGVSAPTFAKWKSKRPTLREALRRGRRKIKGKDVEKFKEFLFGRLTPEMQEVWKEVNQFYSQKNGVLLAEALFVRKGVKVRQCMFLHAMFATNFNASAACRIANIAMKRVEVWMKTDPEFSEMMQEVKAHFKEHVNSWFLELCLEGNPAAIIEAQRKQNRLPGLIHDGYGQEKQVVEVNKTVTGEIKKSVVHSLPLELRQQMAEHIRQQRQIIDAPDSKQIASVPAG